MKYNNYAIILSGSLGAGKSTAAKYLSQKSNYQHLSFVNEIWKPILIERGLEINRSNLQTLGIELMNKLGFEKIVELLLERAIPEKVIIIDDARRKDVVLKIKELCIDSFLIYVDADFNIRFPRLVKRDNVRNEQEQKNAESIETETTIPELKDIADIIIYNSSNLDSFYTDIDNAILLANKKFQNAIQ